MCDGGMVPVSSTGGVDEPAEDVYVLLIVVLRDETSGVIFGEKALYLWAEQLLCSAEVSIAVPIRR